MLLKETLLVRNALNEDLFRYDASELMDRRIGADHLLYALKKYISLGIEFISEITEESPIPTIASLLDSDGNLKKSKSSS